MNIFVFVLTLYAFVTALVCSEDIFKTEPQSCNIYKDISQDYQNDMYTFTIDLFKNFGSNAINNNFVFSPLSVWIILAAIAEGADPTTKLNMFQFLGLSVDPCIRLKYYQLACSRFVSSDDITISSTRTLVIDEGVTINPTYLNFLFKTSLLDVVSAPMRSNPHAALAEIRRVISGALPNIDISGNSVIINAVDYNGLWSTAFENAVVERSPFYSHTGEQIGTVDMMKLKKRARMSHIRSINGKALELPIGNNDRYRMIFVKFIDNNAVRAISDFTNGVLQEYLSNLKESFVPIDIAIPRINVTHEYDVQAKLKDFGIQNLWTDPIATRFISDPAAVPSAFVQRSTLSIGTAGLKPAPFNSQHSYNAPTGLDPILGQDFIADRPFLFGLFDAETYTCIMVTAFTTPTPLSNY